MPRFSGKHNAKVDVKGRLRLPAAFVRRMGEAANDGLVLKTGVDDCLELYLYKTWEAEAERVDALDDYIEENRTFQRMFYSNTAELDKDSNDRINLPKELREHASIDKDVVLVGLRNKIEIWSLENHKIQEEKQKNLNRSQFAQKVMSRPRVD